MFMVTGRCGWCQERGQFRLTYAIGFTAIDPNESDGRQRGVMAVGRISGTPMHGDEGPEVEGAGMAQCMHCNRPTMVVFRTRRRYLDSIIKNLDSTTPLLGGESLIRINSMFPPQPEAEEDPHWPVEIRRHFRDAQDMLMNKMSPSIIIGVCRTVLDVVTRKLEADAKTLSGRIDQLRDRAVVTIPIADWAHSLRLEGNAAVHEAEGTESDAREYIEFLRMLMNIAFTLPARIAEKRHAGE